MILRELLARFGIDYQDTGFKKADRAVNTLKGRVTAMGAAANTAFGSLTRMFGAFAGIYGAKRLIEMGSAANETLNVLNEVFKQNSQGVQEWARAFARDVGRSEYEMRELAGTIGSVVNPLMDQNTEATTEMSKNLAQLAVDLGSFYNVADTDVLVALRAAISGESEPMKRYGVVMLDATLQAYALEKGIRKKYKTMSIAEKTALRYNFMLDKTRQAQGDAKRTSDGYANAIKGVTGALKDLAIGIMLRVMPKIAKFTSYMRDNIIPVLKDVLDNSNIVSAALIVLGARMLLAWAPTLIPMLAVAAVLGAIILLVDELITKFKGGKTVIGKALDKMFGKGTTQALVDNVKNGIKIIKEEFGRFSEKIKEISGKVSEWINNIGVATGYLGEKFDAIVPSVKDVIKWLKEMGVVSDELSKKLEKAFDKILEFVPGLGPVMKAYNAYKGAKELLPSEKQRKEVSEREYTAERGVNARLLKGPSFGQANRETLEDVKKQQTLSKEVKTGTARKAMKPQVMRGPITNRTQNNVTQNNNVTNNVTIPAGASTENVAKQIGRETLRAVSNQTKNILAAHRQGI